MRGRPATIVAVPVDRLKALQADRDELLEALKELVEAADVVGWGVRPEFARYKALIARIEGGR